MNLRGGIKQTVFLLSVKRGGGWYRPIQKILIRKFSFLTTFRHFAHFFTMLTIFDHFFTILTIFDHLFDHFVQ